MTTTLMQRRDFLRLMALGGSAAAQPWAMSFGAPPARAQSAAGFSYGHWVLRNDAPAFAYTTDFPDVPEWDPLTGSLTRRNWLMVGNQAIQLQCVNDGTVALFDETRGMRWLTAPDVLSERRPPEPPSGTGVSIIHDGGKQWGSEFQLRSGQGVPRRTFGPTWFEVQDAHAGLSLTRTILCPEGDVPWVLVRVRLALAGEAAAPRPIRHTERWALRPRFLNALNVFELARPEDLRRKWAELAVTYAVSQTPAGLAAAEKFASASEPGPLGEAAKHLVGPPATLMLERLAATPGTASHSVGTLPGSLHPTLEIETELSLNPGETRDLWFRFGREDTAVVTNPAELRNASLAALSKRLPTAAAPKAIEAEREIPWHTAILTGGVAVDRIIGGHTCNQSSAYSYVMGFNGAARDPLQHALPLVYLQPDLALSVLRNTCAWAKPPGVNPADIGGELPYALDGAKQPTGLLDYAILPPVPYQPSDSNLWAFWLAAEYAAATGDLAAFDAPLAYHPFYKNNAVYKSDPVPLRVHLRRQFRHFIDRVGRGAMGHVRIMHADWNDLAIKESGVSPQDMINNGSSVLNSAMAAWVLEIFGALAALLGETELAAEARRHAGELRHLVKLAWNDKWFHRAYAPGGAPIGHDDLWLEVQPWAILCGAAEGNRAEALLERIADGPGRASPLGTRVRWNPNVTVTGPKAPGIWYSINTTLIWAAARVSPKWASWAWEEWRRMTLANHTAVYPEIWEGTLSGPDAWNATESDRPGRTWGFASIAMQPFPVNNLHSHSQPLLAYLRLLGVEPTARGGLAVGKGGDFRSPVFQLDRGGRGSLQARGAVSLETAHGTVAGGPGLVSW